MNWVPISEGQSIPADLHRATERLTSILSLAKRDFQLYRRGGTIAAVGPLSALLHLTDHEAVSHQARRSNVVLLAGQLPASVDSLQLSEIGGAEYVVGETEAGDRLNEWGEPRGSFTSGITIQLRGMSESAATQRRLMTNAPRKIAEGNDNLSGRSKWFRKRH
jgi:hypothetical protein